MKKDYYEILGVGKEANTEEIKKLFASSRINIIPTRAEVIRANLKRRARLTVFCLTRRKELNMTLMGKPELIADIKAEEEGEVSVISISPVLPDRDKADKETFKILISAMFSEIFLAEEGEKKLKEEGIFQ